MKSISIVKIILLYNVSGLGKSGAVVPVRPGYAKNYLIPKGLAKYATSANLADIEKNAAELEKNHANKVEMANKVKQALTGQSLIFICNASDDGRLYGSVSVKEIVVKTNVKITEAGIKDFAVSAASVNIGSGIKLIGEAPARLHLYDGVDCEISIITCRSEADAKNILEKKKA